MNTERADKVDETKKSAVDALLDVHAYGFFGEDLGRTFTSEQAAKFVDAVTSHVLALLDARTKP